MRNLLFLSSTTLAAAITSTASAQIRITEWQYSGSEYIEITNMGGAPVDMTGWSYDDESNTPGSFSLTGLGILAPGQSGLIAEDTAAAFRTLWGLAATVPVVGGNTHNIGRNDHLFIYNASNVMVDQLRYGDDTYMPGSIRTQNVSGWTTPANLGTNNVYNWQLSVVGDAQNSYTSATGGFIGNPGTYVVPAPGALALLGLAGLVGGVRRRRVA